MSNFDEADKKVHPVEGEWHYPILTKYGFMPVTKVGIGFVRSYLYTKGDHQIRVNTGVNADYWNDLTNPTFGYWSDLEPFLKTLK